MSALFVHSPGNIVEYVALQRGLEIRQIPHIFRTSDPDPIYSNDGYAKPVKIQTSGIPTSDWMMTAPIQLIFNTSAPPWSKDGWSFVPLDLSNATDANIGMDQRCINDYSQLNMSFTTPAIRGRIECSTIDGLQNLTSWLRPMGVSPFADPSTVKPNGTTAFAPGNQAMWIMTPGSTFVDCPGCTSILGMPSVVTCCVNKSSSVYPANSGIGYWSANVNPADSGPRNWQHNFTTKWIYRPIALDRDAESDIRFVDTPSISRLNCQPLVETASAEVSVDLFSGSIRDFHIKDTPKVAMNAFEDNFVIHNDSVLGVDETFYEYSTTLRLVVCSLHSIPARQAKKPRPGY
jgi:hypothetical protein